MTNLDFRDTMKVLNSYNRAVTKQNKQKKLNREYEISKGKNFTLSILYLNVQESGLKSESIDLHGYKNATEIYEIYRKLGHDLELYKIQLFLDDKKIKGVKFI